MVEENTRSGAGSRQFDDDGGTAETDADASTGLSRSRVLRLLLVIVAAAGLGFFGGSAVMSVIELAGPTRVDDGLVLEVGRTQTTYNRCTGPRTPAGNYWDGCRRVEVEEGHVAGERADGGRFIVRDDSASRNALPGYEVEVTTSSVTGRVTGIERSSQIVYDPTRTFVSYFLPAVGLIFAGLLFLIFRHRRRNPTDLVLGTGNFRTAMFGGLTIGVFGMWWVALGPGAPTTDVPTADERFGDVVADPFGFAVTFDDAVEEGFATEIIGTGDLRTIRPSEVGPGLRDALPATGDVAVAIVAMGDDRSSFDRLRVTARRSGEVVDEVDCPSDDLDYPARMGVVGEIRVGLFCFPAGLDDTVVVSTGDEFHELSIEPLTA